MASSPRLSTSNPMQWGELKGCGTRHSHRTGGAGGRPGSSPDTVTSGQTEAAGLRSGTLTCCRRGLTSGDASGALKTPRSAGTELACPVRLDSVTKAMNSGDPA